MDKSEVGNLVMLYGFLGLAYEFLCLILSGVISLANTDLLWGYTIFNPVLSFLGLVYGADNLLPYIFPLAVIVFGFWLSRVPKQRKGKKG